MFNVEYTTVRTLKRHVYAHASHAPGEIYLVPELHAQILAAGRNVQIVEDQSNKNDSISISNDIEYPAFPVKKKRGRPRKEQTYMRRDMRAEP